MIKKIAVVFSIVFLATLFAFTGSNGKSKYKCMIQMTNYTGEGAYVVISLLDPEGNYVDTLYVQGEDDEWYFDISQWWDFYGKKRNNIDAITGATISGGNRAISVIEIPDDKIDAGYKIRFETAVEDQEYYPSDVEFELTTASVNGKVAGKGFIRYVRMMPQ
ncbi:MAG: flagellin biosynthesis protein FlgD [Alteromonas sp.]|nr:flagellin biosynthesis protein FlgD [Alteromonas sp.]MAY22604.1 flagellin biosynthesis protein FlgD [Flavobacteriaceae bacterium]|tara:strand:- start:113125 stop:113610 length:486 start_codon:yes stop_codon:yes gene_type:complete